jgi:hypothetical protein
MESASGGLGVNNNVWSIRPGTGIGPMPGSVPKGLTVDADLNVTISGNLLRAFGDLEVSGAIFGTIA